MMFFTVARLHIFFEKNVTDQPGEIIVFLRDNHRNTRRLINNLETVGLQRPWHKTRSSITIFLYVKVIAEFNFQISYRYCTGMQNLQHYQF